MLNLEGPPKGVSQNIKSQEGRISVGKKGKGPTAEFLFPIAASVSQSWDKFLKRRFGQEPQSAVGGLTIRDVLSSSVAIVPDPARYIAIAKIAVEMYQSKPPDIMPGALAMGLLFSPNVVYLASKIRPVSRVGQAVREGITKIIRPNQGSKTI